VFSRRSFAETALKMTEVAPGFPPLLVSHGVELSHSLRKALGDRPNEDSLWEELLSLRRGSGSDAFFVCPLPPGQVKEDLLLQRAVEIRALVDAVRAVRDAFPGQPLDRVLRQGRLRSRREVVPGRTVFVAVRLGSSFIVLPVDDEHPRALADRIVQLFASGARKVGRLRPRRVVASLLVALDPVPFEDALHLHRLGLEGPWLSWSTTSSAVSLGVLSAHHLVLEGPSFGQLRADFGGRVRALSFALGLGGSDEDWDPRADFGPFDAQPFGATLGSADVAEATDPRSLIEGQGEALGLDPEFVARIVQAEKELEQARASLGDRALFSVSPEEDSDEADLSSVARALPPELRPLLEGERLRGVQGTGRLQTWRAPSLRYATVPRGAFSFADYCYAYCRAQHEAMAVYQPLYPGAGFTFVVPRAPEPTSDSGAERRSPVLCSFRTVRGVPEARGPFKHRLGLRLAEAEAGSDLLSRVLEDVLRASLPDVCKAVAVRAFESRLHDGGSFLSGRGLVSHIVLPDDVVDPVASYGGIFEGLFAGSCQERGGVSLTTVDRGYRRDICAVGTGIFRSQAAMDLFWHRLAYFLGQAAM
jgi:hypothetical protein